MLTQTTWSYFYTYFQCIIFYLSKLKLGLVCPPETFHVRVQCYPVSLLIQNKLIYRKHQWNEYITDSGMGGEGAEYLYKNFRVQTFTCFLLRVTQITACYNPRGTYRNNIPLWEEQQLNRRLFLISISLSCLQSLCSWHMQNLFEVPRDPQKPYSALASDSSLKSRVSLFKVNKAADRSL